MKKAMVIINPTSGGEKALDYKEKLEKTTILVISLVSVLCLRRFTMLK
ncbi:sphingosine kinase [Streptococcus pneumoniae]|nr:sphingosine kinase [Streptococcus pneumoniae]